MLGGWDGAGSGLCVAAAAGSTTEYVADIGRFTLLIDHSVRAAIVCS